MVNQTEKKKTPVLVSSLHMVLNVFLVFDFIPFEEKVFAKKYFEPVLFQLV